MTGSLTVYLGKQALYFAIRVPAQRFLLQDEICPHATASEVLHAVHIIGAISVSVEMSRAVVANVFQEPIMLALAALMLGLAKLPEGYPAGVDPMVALVKRDFRSSIQVLEESHF